MPENLMIFQDFLLYGVQKGNKCTLNEQKIFYHSVKKLR